MTAAAVSVVIPAYNAAATLERCLASVAGQVRPPDEVIVVDDASSDATADIAAAFALSRLRVVRLDANGGPGHARNVGVKAAANEWVAFLDADDEWLPELLEEALAAADATAARVVGCGGIRVMHGRGSRARERRHVVDDLGRVRDVTADYWRLGVRALTPAGMLVRRDLMLRLGGFPEDMRRSEDTVLNARLWLDGPIWFIDRVLYRSVQTAGSLSSSPPSYADTRRLLARVGMVALKAAMRRRPGAGALLRAYPSMIWHRHRRWLDGRLGRPTD